MCDLDRVVTPFILVFKMATTNSIVSIISYFVFYQIFPWQEENERKAGEGNTIICFSLMNQK